jgi:putative DNA primase/helicase
MRVYGGAASPEVEVARAILRRIKRGDLPRDGFSSRDVWRPGWAGLADRDLVSVALAYLVDVDWLKAEVVKTDGRPATLYTVNPRGKL